VDGENGKRGRGGMVVYPLILGKCCTPSVRAAQSNGAGEPSGDEEGGPATRTITFSRNLARHRPAGVRLRKVQPLEAFDRAGKVARGRSGRRKPPL
jgi:hypothetical protein